MNRREAEEIATAVRVYVEAHVAAYQSDNPKAEALARLAFERMVDAFVQGSRHG